MAPLDVFEDDIYTLSTGNGRMLNEEKFDLLYHEYYSSLVIYACNFVSSSKAEEIVQNMMSWLWKNRNTLEIKMPVRNYLLRSLHRLCVKRMTQTRTDTETIPSSRLQQDTSFVKDADNPFCNIFQHVVVLLPIFLYFCQ